MNLLSPIQEKSKAPAHYIDIECLASSLLDLANEADLCHMFLIGEDSIPFSIVYFYQWLVAHDVKLNIYETILAAVSTDGVSRILDVSAVQMFLSRTIRQQHSPRKVADVDPTSLDDGDEL